MSNTGIIYKLCCKDVNITDIYVGSTKNFTRRKHQHKTTCNNTKNAHHNLYVYSFMRGNGGWDNWDMIQIEEYRYETKRELLSRERHFIEALKAGLNKNIPTRTNKEWYQDNKEYYKKKTTLYYQHNKEKCLEKHKELKEKNKEKLKQIRLQKITCECGVVVSVYNKQRHFKSKNHKFYQQMVDYIFS